MNKPIRNQPLQRSKANTRNFTDVLNADGVPGLSYRWGDGVGFGSKLPPRLEVLFLALHLEVPLIQGYLKPPLHAFLIGEMLPSSSF